MSWNKIICEACQEEITPKEVIRSTKAGVSTYKICPKCSFPTTALNTKSPGQVEQHIIDGMTKRSHIKHPDCRHISNMKIPTYKGHQHFIRQAILLSK